MSKQKRLSTTDNNRIKKVLERHPIIHLALLFGSLAKSKGRDDSDLDFAVSAQKPLTVQEKIQLITELAVATGRPVDLVDLSTVGEPLLGQILKGGKRILGDNSHYAVMLCKHLFNQADFMPYRSRILQERRQRWIGI